MNELERQAMLAAIRAVATSVAEIANIVADLPVQLQTRLDEHRATMAGELKDIRGHVDAAGVAHAALVVELRTIVETNTVGLQTLGETNVAEFANHARIIADNRVEALEANQVAHERITEASANVKLAGEKTLEMMAGLGESIHSLDGNLGGLRAIVETQGASMQENSRTVAETFAELRVGIDERICSLNTAELSGRVASMAGEVFNLNAELPKLREEILDARVEVKASTIEMQDAATEQAAKMADEIKAASEAVVVSLKPIVEDLANVHIYVEQNKTELINQIEHSATAARAMVDMRVKETELVLFKGIADVSKEVVDVVKTAEDRGNEYAIAAINENEKILREDLNRIRTDDKVEMNSLFGAVAEQMAAEHPRVMMAIDNLREQTLTFAQVDEQIRDSLGSMPKDLATLGERITFVAEASLERYTKAMSGIDELRPLMLTADAVREMIPDTAAQIDDKILSSLGDMPEQIVTLEKKITGVMETNFERHVAAMAAINEVQEKAVTVDAVLALIPAPVPVGATPEQMAELRTSLAAYAQQAPVPDFDLQVEYTDDGLAVVAVRDGLPVSRAVVPVDIGVRYIDVYEPDRAYKAGEMVTYNGSGWICRVANAGRPGQDLMGWTLAIKCGADGKDGHTTKAYDHHEQGTRYKRGDFLRIHNRLWQAVRTTLKVPEGSQHSSTPEWMLIGGVQ